MTNDLDIMCIDYYRKDDSSQRLFVELMWTLIKTASVIDK